MFLLKSHSPTTLTFTFPLRLISIAFNISPTPTHVLMYPLRRGDIEILNLAITASSTWARTLNILLIHPPRTSGTLQLFLLKCCVLRSQRVVDISTFGEASQRHLHHVDVNFCQHFHKKIAQLTARQKYLNVVGMKLPSYWPAVTTLVTTFPQISVPIQTGAYCSAFALHIFWDDLGTGMFWAVAQRPGRLCNWMSGWHNCPNIPVPRSTQNTCNVKIEQ